MMFDGTFQGKSSGISGSLKIAVSVQIPTSNHQNELQMYSNSMEAPPNNLGSRVGSSGSKKSTDPGH